MALCVEGRWKNGGCFSLRQLGVPYVFQPYNGINEIGIAENQRFLTVLNHSSQNLHKNPKKKSLVITLVLKGASLPYPSKKSTIQRSTSIWKP